MQAVPATTTNTEGVMSKTFVALWLVIATTGEPQVKDITVPDPLLKELTSLRVSYASLLRQYKRELQNSPKAQEVFVETLPGLLHRGLSSDRTFQSYFDTLVEEEVSLFNVAYLKEICFQLPKDVW